MRSSSRNSWSALFLSAALVTGCGKAAQTEEDDLTEQPGEERPETDGGLPDAGETPPDESDGTNTDIDIPDAGPLPPETDFVQVGTSLQLINPDAVPEADRMLFNVYASKGGHDYQMRREASMRLGNADDAAGPLTISALTVTGEFQVTAPTKLPVILEPGERVTVTVAFTATSGKKVHFGNLAVGSDDATTPSKDIKLAGIWMERPERSNELSFAEGMKVFGYGTTVLLPGQTMDNQGRIETVGDEVIVPRWKVADARKPVRIRQLAAFRNWTSPPPPKPGQPPRPAVGAFLEWEDLSVMSPGEVLTVFITANADCQRVLPRSHGSELPAAGQFSPPGAFRFSIDGFMSSEPARFYEMHPDYWPNCTDATKCGHMFRVYPLKLSNGTVVANSYFMTMDFAGGNYDNNDNIYLLENLKPATP